MRVLALILVLTAVFYCAMAAPADDSDSAQDHARWLGPNGEIPCKSQTYPGYVSYKCLKFCMSKGYTGGTCETVAGVMGFCKCT